MKLRGPKSWLGRMTKARLLPLKLGFAVAIAVLALHAAGVFAPLEHLFSDMHFQLRGALPISDKVVVVGVSPECTRELGAWPWPRRYHAELIRKLARAGARVICFDMYFSRPSRDPQNDRAMVDAARTADNVVLAVYKRDSLSRNLGHHGPLLRVAEVAQNLPALTAVTQQGHINVRHDRDGTIRRVPAGLERRESRYYQLGVLGACRHMGFHPDRIVPERGGLRLGERFLPTDASGNLQVNYYHLPDQLRTYFVSAILADRVDPKAFRDKAVFVGQTDHGLQNADLVVTPEGERFGVFVQATMADNILSDRVLHRASFAMLALVVLALSMACAWRLFAWRALGKVVWSMAFGGLAVLATHYAFDRLHLLIDLTPCLAVVVGDLGGALVVGILMADREVERRDLEMQTLLEAGKLSAGGERAAIPERIVAGIGRALGAEGCCLYLCEKGGEPELAASYGFGGALTAAQAAAASQRANRHVAVNRRAFYGSGASGDGEPLLGDERIHSALIVPLAAQDQLYGTLGLYNKQPSPISPQREFTEHDFRLISLLTQQTTMTLDRSRLADDLREALVDLEAAQQQLVESERLSAVGRMANMIIHDIKNPMQGIRMFAEMAAEADLSAEDRKEFSGTMCREIDRLVGMCQEILDFARGTTSLAMADVELDDFLMETVLGLAPELEQGHIELDTRLGFGGTIRIDANRVRRVAINLCRNAIEAMAHDGGTLRVATARGAEGAAEIEIADTGPGIPPEIADSLFEPFVTHGKDHGTGLGLAIVKKVVEDHGGTIDVATQPGEGTSFAIHLPAAAEGEGAEGGESAAGAAADPPARAEPHDAVTA